MEGFVVRRTGWAVWTPAAFYQQLQSLNLGRVWQSVNAPVLVVYGTGDTVMSRADSDAIAETVNGVHPGAARNYVVERMNHLFEIDKMMRWCPSC
jgi:pimeloyl-ACP methyl ester carboxylesterase